MTYTTSAHGRALIAAREGCRLTAYQDSVGIWTVGVGHTGRASPPSVTAGMKITAAQADQMLANDLVEFERSINACVHAPLQQNAFDALVSLAFNIGAAAFASSTVVKQLNAGDVAGAANAFLMWDRAGGKVLVGLQTRRADERQQFLTPYPSAIPSSPAKPPIAREPPVTPAPQGFWAWLGSLFSRKAA